MARILCTHCNESFSMALAPGQSASCPLCDRELRAESSALAAVTPRPGEPATAPEPTVVLQHLRTGERIELRGQTRYLLGRGQDAGETLSRIAPQISRQHCLLELEGDGFLLSDAGSTHGTFLLRAHNHLDCREQPRRRLEQNDILALGQEHFLVSVTTAGDTPAADTTTPSSPGTEAPKAGMAEPEFICSACNHIAASYSAICPECGRHDTMRQL